MTRPSRTPAETVLVASIAVSGWAGILVQGWLSVTNAMAGGEPLAVAVVNYLGYYTVLTNLAVATAASAWFAAPQSRLARLSHHASFHTALVTSIVLVGLAYHTLLRSYWNPDGPGAVANAFLHYITPVLALVHWLGFMRPEVFPWTAPARWALFPVSYFFLVMARGSIDGYYPYPFFELKVLGVGRVVANAVGLLLLFAVIALAGTAVARWRVRMALRS